MIGPLIPPGLSDIRVANLAYLHGAPPLPAVRDLRCGARVALDPSEWPQAQAWVLRRYDVSTVGFVVEHLPGRGGVFFDIGGHIGLIGCQVAVQRGDAIIHAFEPHPRVAAQYRKNMQLNDVSGVVVEAAASSRAGTVEFSLDSHSIGRGATTVPTLRLDDYIAENGIDRIDVMKLDVEGHELEALEGARNALQTGVIRAVTMESMSAHGHDVDAPAQLLAASGFQVCPMPDPRASWIQRVRVHRSGNVAYVKLD